jgi:hypothetical protein
MAITLSATVLGIISFWVFARPPRAIQVALADGRILQIEGVTYGTAHRIGQRAQFYEHFHQWLPPILDAWLRPKHAESRIDLERPALVVWVNAIDPKTGTNVDCQAIRTDLVDQYGEVFGEETSSWHGGNDFWRAGHIFYVYPRDEKMLTFQMQAR